MNVNARTIWRMCINWSTATSASNFDLTAGPSHQLHHDHWQQYPDEYSGGSHQPIDGQPSKTLHQVLDRRIGFKPIPGPGTQHYNQQAAREKDQSRQQDARTNAPHRTENTAVRAECFYQHENQQGYCQQQPGNRQYLVQHRIRFFRALSIPIILHFYQLVGCVCLLVHLKLRLRECRFADQQQHDEQASFHFFLCLLPT